MERSIGTEGTGIIEAIERDGWEKFYWLLQEIDF